MTMTARPVGSLCTHGPMLLEGQSAVQETIVYGSLCKPRATWNEVGLYLCCKEECAWCGVSVLCVFVRVAM